MTDLTDPVTIARLGAVIGFSRKEIKEMVRSVDPHAEGIHEMVDAALAFRRLEEEGEERLIDAEARWQEQNVGRAPEAYAKLIGVVMKSHGMTQDEAIVHIEQGVNHGNA